MESTVRLGSQTIYKSHTSNYNTETGNLNIGTETRQDISTSTISNTQIHDGDFCSIYKSTDFYSKDIDEKIEVPIELKNYELNNNTSSTISKYYTTLTLLIHKTLTEV